MVDTTVSGPVHGNVYALVAVDISLIFSTTGAVNFAQGSIVGFGAMLGWWFIGVRGWPWWLALLAMAASGVLIDWIISLTAVRPLIKTPPIAALLATFAASMVFDNLSQILSKAGAREYLAPLPTDGLPVGRVRLGASGAVALGFTIATILAPQVWLRFGHESMAIRATAADPDTARQMGIPVTRVQNLSFLLAFCLGGVGGIFFDVYTGVISPYSASFIGTVGFIAAAVGGLGPIVDAMVGGFVIGLPETLGIYQFGGSFRSLFIFGAFLLVLLLRPHGLFGSWHTVSSEPMVGIFLEAGHPPRLAWWHWVLFALVTGLAMPLLSGPVLSSIGTQVTVYAIIVAPMTSLAGPTGQVSLGQTTPVAIGAYASAPLVMRLDLPFLVALLLAGMIAAVLATLVTLPVWRLGDHYVSVATLALGYVILSVIRSWNAVTKGARGLSGVPAPKILGLRLLVAEDHYQLDLVVLAVTLVVVFRTRSSHLDNVLAAVGSGEIASRSLGLHTCDYKALAYALAAFFTGMTGTLLTRQYNCLDPTMFTAQMSMLMLTIVVLGGINSPFEAVLGSLALVGLPEAPCLAPGVRILLYGIVMVAIVRFLPQGLWTRSA